VQTTSDRNRFATAHGAVNRRLHHPQSRRIPVQPTPDIDRLALATLVDFRSQLHCCQKTAALSFSAKTSPGGFAAAKSCGLFRIATTIR
jgi:hypothetical protein